MPPLNVAAISINTTPLDFRGNLDKILKSLRSETVIGSDFILFPELCISGYGCEDAFFKESVWQRSWASLEAILPATKGKTVIVGLPVFFGSHLYNCAAVIDDMKIIALVPKMNLANTGIHYEKRWFHSTNGLFVDEYLPHYSLDRLRASVPFGHFLFEKKGIRFAIEICEDSWVSSRTSHSYAEQGLDILFSPGASHFARGKREIRHRIFMETSRTQRVLTVYTNLCGNESGRTIFDGGPFFCVNGKMVREGERLFFQDLNITTFAILISELRSMRAREMRSLSDPESLKKVPVIFILPTNASKLILDMRTNLVSKITQFGESHPLSEYEDFTKAVSLGLFDYLKKSKSKGFTLSLSGGADSAACALLVISMKEIAKSELGETIFNDLGLDEKKLLVTLFQKTENNSALTEEIAQILTTELGTEHHKISIDESVSLATNLLETQLKRKLNWESDDLALQNIQARVRSPLIWLLANLNNHLLLSTGNRSEGSVGYTTIDGDSSGSICPISGISKEFLLRWIDDIQDGKNRYIKPKESLKLLRKTRPTAELRPLEARQEDEKDLMPYPILQEIERYLIYLGVSPEECLKEISDKHPDLQLTLLKQQIERFTSLFSKSQWKRERLPPSFHLDEYGLDPKTSYRYPILSGEF